MHRDMADRVWGVIGEQARAAIIDKLGHYYPVEMVESLEHASSWTDSFLINDVRFEYENAEFTMLQLCNTVEMLTINDYEFAETMRVYFMECLKEILKEYKEEITDEHVTSVRVGNYSGRGRKAAV